MHKDIFRFRANIEVTGIVDPVQIGPQQDAVGKNFLAAVLHYAPEPVHPIRFRTSRR